MVFKHVPGPALFSPISTVASAPVPVVNSAILTDQQRYHSSSYNHSAPLYNVYHLVSSTATTCRTSTNTQPCCPLTIPVSPLGRSLPLSLAQSKARRKRKSVPGRRTLGKSSSPTFWHTSSLNFAHLPILGRTDRCPFGILCCESSPDHGFHQTRHGLGKRAGLLGQLMMLSHIFPSYPFIHSFILSFIHSSSVTLLLTSSTALSWLSRSAQNFSTIL